MTNHNWVLKGCVVFVFGLITLLLPIEKAGATHLRAGQITVTRDNCSNRRVKITVTVYTDTESSVLFGGSQDILDFGDGNQILVPEVNNTPYPGGGNIGVASYSTFYTYGGQGKFTISYREPNRNGGVLNMANSVGTTFYIETQIDLSTLGCGNSPELLVPPIDRACVGVAFYHNPGAYDSDGDSLSYELVVPFSDRSTEVVAYRSPNDGGFYPNFLQGNEDGDGPPTFKIDSVSGTLKWDAPGLPQGVTFGEFNIAFIVKEWRNTNGAWTQIGFVRRDMQIIVEKCENERPRLEIPDDICVVAGTTLNATIFGYDDTFYQHKTGAYNGVFKKDDDPVQIEAFSEIFASTFPSRASVDPLPAEYRVPPAELQFTWNTTCEHVKDQAYQVVFKITDNPALNPDPNRATGGPKLVTFETWRITVVAPPPLWEPPIVNVATRSVDLEWESYICEDEAFRMQIWRKVGETNFTPSECQTGLPESLGFALIAQVPASQTTFTDTNAGKGLDVGAQYCYRLVAIFSEPRGGESIASDEICIPPIKSDAPVITNVTIDKTGDTDGEITVRWTAPFDIDPIQFPGPYKYLVQRANGSAFINVSGNPPSYLDNLFFIDQGLNTRDVIYLYRVVLYSPTNIDPTYQAIDTSALASSVSLNLKPRLGEITLTWSALVPWSNQFQNFPLHDIYRGPAGSTEADLQLIGTFATVDVLQEGFKFVDPLVGNPPLDENTEYCYRVMTRGGYGNPAIPVPLENYSQISCAFAKEDSAPCAPVITSEANSCSDASACSQLNYNNEFSWETDCEEEVKNYIIYYARSTDVEKFVPLVTVPKSQLSYSHLIQNSRAYCYRIRAESRSGVLSEFSEPICFDNCPYYELPNVFTPGDGNDCNDLFRAFGANLGEDPNCPPVDPTNDRCARFVLRVDFSVYNRWGRKVYNFIGQIGDINNSIYINWDGRDNNGNDLTTGVYYYLADVTFDLADPSKRVQQRKGWIHIIRNGSSSSEN